MPDQALGVADVVAEADVTPTSVVGRVSRSSLVPARWVTMLTGLRTLTTPFVISHDVGKMSITPLTAAAGTEWSIVSNARLLEPRRRRAYRTAATLNRRSRRPSPGSIALAVAHHDEDERVAGPTGLTIVPRSSGSSSCSPSMATTTSAARRPAAAAGWPRGPRGPRRLGRLDLSPSIEYTVNSSTIAIIMCISEPAEITSIRRG